MALSVVQGAQGVVSYGQGPGTVTTSAINTTTGSTFLVFVAQYTDGALAGGSPPVTDNKGNAYAWAQVAGAGSPIPLIEYASYAGGGMRPAIKYAGNGGSSHAVSSTFTAGEEATLFVLELAGGVTNIPDNQQRTNASSTTHASPTATATGPAIAIATIWGLAWDTSLSVDNGFTLDPSLHYQGSGNSIQGAIAYKYLPAGGSASCTWTIADAQETIVSMMILQGDAAPGTLTATPTATASTFSSATIRWSGEPPAVSASGTTESGTANVTTFNAAIGSPTSGTGVLLVVTKDGSADFASLPSGWTVVSNNLQGTAIRSAVLWKVCNGTEGATAALTVSSAESFVSHYWQFTAGTFDAATAPQAALNAVATANNNPAALTPSWGAANNYWICTLAQDTNSAAPTYPTGYGTGQGTQRSTNTTTGDRTRLSWCAKTANAASDDPAAWTSAAVASVAYTIAVRPYVATVVSRTLTATVTATTSTAQTQSVKHNALATASAVATASTWAAVAVKSNHVQAATVTATISTAVDALLKKSKRLVPVGDSTLSPFVDVVLKHASLLQASSTGTDSSWASVTLSKLVRRLVTALVTSTDSIAAAQLVKHSTLLSVSAFSSSSVAASASVGHFARLSTSSTGTASSPLSVSIRHSARVAVTVDSTVSTWVNQTTRRTRLVSAAVASSSSTWATVTLTHAAVVARSIQALSTATTSTVADVALKSHHRAFAGAVSSSSVWFVVNVRHLASNSYAVLVETTATTTTTQSAQVIANHRVTASPTSTQSTGVASTVRHDSRLVPVITPTASAWVAALVRRSSRVAANTWQSSSSWATADIVYTVFGAHVLSVLAGSSVSSFASSGVLRGRRVSASVFSSASSWASQLLASDRRVFAQPRASVTNWPDQYLGHNSAVVASSRATVSTWRAVILLYSGLVVRIITAGVRRTSSAVSGHAVSAASSGGVARVYRVQ